MQIRHPNRQTDKRKDKTFYEKTNTPGSSDIIPGEIYGVLTKDTLKELAEFRSDRCITIILPTHQSGMEVNEQQDVIQFKNVLQNLRNADPAKFEKILAPAFDLLRNDEFWRDQGKGLAMFIADGYFKYVKLPFTPEQECIVNNSFYLINLLQLLNTHAADEFYLLLIRRDKTKLYKSDASGLHEEKNEDMPENINSVINFDEEDTPENIDAGRPEKVIIETFIEKINTAFQNQAPQDTSWPLMLAGQEELLEAFRKTSQYENILDTEVIVSDEYVDAKELFQQARQKIEERQQRERDIRLETYYNSIATNLTSSMPEHVIPATYYSQVRALFVEKGAHIWGSFDQQNNRIDMHVSQEDGDDCLIEKAAVQTILHGGEVFILEKDKMPKGATLAALLRYAQ